jgi:hypothetical protein
VNDYRIRMQFDIGAEQKTVLDALTSTAGIASWWSDRVDGNPGDDGGELSVAFPGVPQPFHFAVRRGTDELAWTTGEFPPWWAGTTIRWQLTDNPDGPGTRLLFSHEGFDPEAEIIPVITPAWADIITRLKRYAETGDVNPFGRN